MHNIALLLSHFPLDFGHFALILWEAIKKVGILAQPVGWDKIPTSFLNKSENLCIPCNTFTSKSTSLYILLQISSLIMHAMFSNNIEDK